MEGPVLNTPRLILRPLGADDADEFRRLCQHEDVQRWTNVPVPFTEENAKEYILGKYADGWKTGDLCVWGSFSRDTEKLASVVGIFRGRYSVGEIFTWTSPANRGKGCTAESMKAVIRWSFETLGLRRIEAQIMIENTKSRAMVERLGFEHEGLLRARVSQRGIPRDIWMMRLLPRDCADWE